MKNLILLFISAICFSCETKIHTIEITYCDGRKDTVLFEKYTVEGRPSNGDIHTYREALPVLEEHLNGRKYINVCEVKTLK